MNAAVTSVTGGYGQADVEVLGEGGFSTGRVVHAGRTVAWPYFFAATSRPVLIEAVSE